MRFKAISPNVHLELSSRQGEAALRGKAQAMERMLGSCFTDLHEELLLVVMSSLERWVSNRKWEPAVQACKDSWDQGSVSGSREG